MQEACDFVAVLPDGYWRCRTCGRQGARKPRYCEDRQESGRGTGSSPTWAAPPITEGVRPIGVAPKRDFRTMGRAVLRGLRRAGDTVIGGAIIGIGGMYAGVWIFDVIVRLIAIVLGCHGGAR